MLMHKPIALILGLVGLWALDVGFLSASEYSPPYFGDAALRALHFVDKKEGWTVGDEGVIWHSVDGGSQWERQSSGTRASLRSVHFLNPYFGWAVGAEYDSALGSVGVVLVTKDGGLKWTKVLANTFPGLFCVGFLDEKVGYLAGDCSAGFPSGVFQTVDGGKTWSPIPGQGFSSWRSMGFASGKTPVFAGVRGSLGMFLDGKILPLNPPGENPSDFKSIFFSEKRGGVVGKSGIILESDGGSGFSTWNIANSTIPTELSKCMQLNCVGGAGAVLCAAGFPGSMIVHRDQENVWKASKIDNHATIHALRFLDELHGWAVGDLGTILKTLDGGKTWKCVKKGASQHRVLLVSSGPGTMQPELAAFLGYAEGQIVGASCLDDVGKSGEPGTSMDVRFDLATRGSGTSSAIMLGKYPRLDFDNASPEKIVAHWDKFQGSRSADRLVQELALLVRARRPDVIVFAEGVEDFRSAHSQTVFHALLSGIEKANANNFVFFDGSGLEPWNVKQVIYPEEYGRSRVRLDLSMVHRGLQAPLFDVGLPARKILAQPLKAPSLGFVGHGKSVQIKNVFEGLEPGVPEVNARDLGITQIVDKAIVRAYQNANLLRHLAESPLDAKSDPGLILSSVNSLVGKLPDERAASTLGGIASGFYGNGHWSHAREIYKQIIASYPASNQAAEAFAWLIIHDASSEARRRFELNQFISRSEHKFGVPGAEMLPVTLPKDIFSSDSLSEDQKSAGDKKGPPKLPNIPKIESEIRGDKKVLNHQAEARAWLQNSISLSTKYHAYGPIALRNPNVFFSVLAAKRNLGMTGQVREDLESFLGRGPQQVWKVNALAENWIIERKGNCPKKNLMCVRKEARPLLDGVLDDPCWQGLADSIAGPSGMDQTASAKFKVFYDDMFLYLGAQCKGHYQSLRPVGNQKPRDGNLRGQDRVFIRLDLDRDYTTACQFEVSSKGEAVDSLWNDKSWNPTWFFKVTPDADGWTMEAAIPWSSLMGSPVTDGKSWAVNFGRVISGEEVHSWSGNPQENGVFPGLEHSGLMFFHSNEAGMAKNAIPAKKP